MSVSNHGDKINLTSTNDLSTKQYYLVKQSSDTNCVISAAGTDKILGALLNKPRAGETAEIAKSSGGATIKVIAGGTVARGDYLTSDANGKAITTVTAGNVTCGRALQSAVANDIFEMEGGHFII